MAKIDPTLRLSEGEIDELLSTTAHCRIATLGRDAQINLTLMTFGWAEGDVYIFGRGQKIANLRRNPTATVLVDVGERWLELKGVMLRGEGRILETEAEKQQDPDLAAARWNIGTKDQLAHAEPLRNSNLMETHFSPALLYSDRARCSIVPPDRDPIPNTQLPPGQWSLNGAINPAA